MYDGVLFHIRVNAMRDRQHPNKYLTIILRNRGKYSAAIHLDLKKKIVVLLRTKEAIYVIRSEGNH